MPNGGRKNYNLIQRDWESKKPLSIPGVKEEGEKSRDAICSFCNVLNAQLNRQVIIKPNTSHHVHETKVKHTQGRSIYIFLTGHHNHIFGICYLALLQLYVISTQSSKIQLFLISYYVFSHNSILIHNLQVCLKRIKNQVSKWLLKAKLTCLLPCRHCWQSKQYVLK